MKKLYNHGLWEAISIGAKGFGFDALDKVGCNLVLIAALGYGEDTLTDDQKGELDKLAATWMKTTGRGAKPGDVMQAAKKTAEDFNFPGTDRHVSAGVYITKGFMDKMALEMAKLKADRLVEELEKAASVKKTSFEGGAAQPSGPRSDGRSHPYGDDAAFRDYLARGGRRFCDSYLTCPLVDGRKPPPGPGTCRFGSSCKFAHDVCGRHNLDEVMDYCRLRRIAPILS